MKGLTHLAFGICTGITAAVLMKDLTMAEKGMLLGSCALGSFISDADIPTSLIGKLIKPISKIINNMFGHRTFLHSPSFYALLYLIVHILKVNKGIVVPSACVIGFTIGFFGHLVLDTLTVGGIPWLYPFSRSRLHLTNFCTGSKAEPVLATVTFILFALAFYRRDILNDYISIALFKYEELKSTININKLSLDIKLSFDT